MKKSLLALAVLGAFAGTASAQSSVTIYGLLDLAITKGNDGNAATRIPGASPAAFTNPGGNYSGSTTFVLPGGGTISVPTPSEAWTMKQSASSRLGFRGNEDLGGGLSAQFQIEHRFTPDDGAANSIFWAGRSYVQLTSAAAGSVYLGREYDPAFWPAVKSDPFGWDGVGQISSMQYAGFFDTNGGSQVRTANTIGYKSPNLGGLTLQAAMGLSEGPTAGRNQGFNVEYAAGPIYAGLGYLRVSKGTVADGNSLMNLALHYDFGIAKLIGYYARAKTNLGQASNKVFEIGATAPIGPGKLKAAWARLDPDNSDIGVSSDKVQKIAVGYDYPLSKRTNVYADFGQFKSDVDGTTTNRAYAFGVKHTF